MAFGSFLKGVAKVGGTLASLTPTPQNALNIATRKATGGRLGFDVTPGYDLGSVARTQLGKIGSSPAVGTISNPQQLQPQNTGGLDENGGTGNYIGNYAGNGTGGSGTGTVDYSAQYRQQIQDKFKALQDVFNGLFGKIDDVYKQKADEVNKQYDVQGDNLNKTYTDTLNGTNMAYAGRGLGNSSYLGTALDANTNTYQKNLDEINTNRQNSNAQLGEQLVSSKAGANAQLGTYGGAVQNLGNYSEADLSGINGNLDTALQQARVQNDTMLTNPQFTQQLASIAPSVNTGSEQLKTQLSNLVNSSAPAYAKRQIASSLIKRQAQNGQDATVWTNYFDSLLGSQG